MRQLYQVFSEELTVPLDVFTMRTEHYELDYHDGWLKHLTVAQISKRLALAPVGDASPTPEGCTRLLFTPHPSFGDGTHVTTRLAANAIEAQFRGKAGMRLLDVGTGNGVLCLVAAHYGASTLGIDIDPEAIECAQANATTNGFDELCRFDTMPIDEVCEEFDFVVANLEPLTQLELSQQLASKIRANGRLWLTGFLPEQQEEIAFAYESSGFVVDSSEQQEQYVLLTLRKKGLSASEAKR
jgi:ribosomal protein L11 methyltransferase